MTTQAENRPVSDKVTRERTFEVMSKRADKKDALGQVAITLDQLLKDPKFVGQIVLNCNGGHVNSIQVKETTKV